MPKTKPATPPQPNKQQIAYDYIKAGIDRGTFAPRQRLVIDSLARELLVSQVPVREAIRRLEAEGLVEFSANSGAVVSGADSRLWLQLMEMLALLEGYATGVAAPRITKRDLKKLRETNQAMREALVRFDFEDWTEGNLVFHGIINARCENTVLVDQILNLRARIATISRFVFPHSDAVMLHTLGPEGGKSALDSHEWIIGAFERKETPELIERHGRDHIMHIANRTRELLDSGSDRTRAPRAARVLKTA